MKNIKKIINDPVYGFVNIPTGLINDLVHHPYFQRLRRIKQLGLTEYVYPGALHTRFHHVLGAMHLMHTALDVLRSKGHDISEKEKEAAMVAILLHDIGHGPFSHALEYTILKGVTHEHLSSILMHKLNQEFNGALDLAIQIFENRYERRFFHQLVSSQLDMDRMDYIQRDSYFTGVVEGKVGADRILRMLDLVDDMIVVEEKGIYSVEKFLIARRLMYWQVYLHKTTVSTEQMLIKTISRARHLSLSGEKVRSSTSLSNFLNSEVHLDEFVNNQQMLENFAALDDYDIWGSIKEWVHHDDLILRELSQMILNRRLFKVILSNEAGEVQNAAPIKQAIKKHYNIKGQEAKFFYAKGSITNATYVSGNQNIYIKTKKGNIVDIAEISDLPNIKALSKIVKKYYLCFPKHISL